MIAPAVFLFFLLQSSKGSIEGAVINSVTNKPIAGAQVQATRVPAPMPTNGALPTGRAGGVTGTPTATGIVLLPAGGAAPTQISPATTDAIGHFAFTALEPVTYCLRPSPGGDAGQVPSRRARATNAL